MPNLQRPNPPPEAEGLSGDLLQLLHRWRSTSKQQGWYALALTLLDAFAPLVPLTAQAWWVIEPLFGGLPHQDKLNALATLLDDPQGMARLRDIWQRGAAGTGTDAQESHTP
jgi:hypothetical protein